MESDYGVANLCSGCHVDSLLLGWSSKSARTNTADQYYDHSSWAWGSGLGPAPQDNQILKVQLVDPAKIITHAPRWHWRPFLPRRRSLLNIATPPHFISIHHQHSFIHHLIFFLLLQNSPSVLPKRSTTIFQNSFHTNQVFSSYIFFYFLFVINWAKFIKWHNCVSRWWENTFTRQRR